MSSSARNWQNGLERGFHRDAHARTESGGINNTSTEDWSWNGHRDYFSWWAEHQQKTYGVVKQVHMGNYKQVIRLQWDDTEKQQQVSWCCLQGPHHAISFIPNDSDNIPPNRCSDRQVKLAYEAQRREREKSTKAELMSGLCLWAPGDQSLWNLLGK